MSTPASNHDLPFAKELFEAADRMRGSVESAGRSLAEAERGRGRAGHSCASALARKVDRGGSSTWSRGNDCCRTCRTCCQLGLRLSGD